MLPLEDELRTIIERRVKARRLDCQRIFNRSGRPIGEYRKSWAKAALAAGLAVREDRGGKQVPYDLRRTTLRNTVRGGTDPAVAMKISGHRTRAVFDRYNIISEDDLRTAVRRTTAYVASLPTTGTVMPLAAARETKASPAAERSR